MTERCVVRHDVSEVQFGVYKEEEILRLSVVRVSTAATYDRLGNPLPGGLYDPAMGPLDARSICVTCNLSMRDCPGHMGHFPLSLHVYNPLTFGIVFQALRVKCFGCHGFRLSTFPCNVLALKLGLIDAGLAHEADSLDQALFRADLHRSTILRDTEMRLRRHLQTAGQVPKSWIPGETKIKRRALIKDFLQEVLSCKTCDRCSAPKTTVRKDGYTKFFVRGRRAGHSRGAGAHIPSALAVVRNGRHEVECGNGFGDDSDGEESEEGGGEEDAASQERFAARGGDTEAEGGEYMAPAEVQMHMKLLWEAEPELATLIWGKAAVEKSVFSAPGADTGRADGWKTLFWRVLPVTPSRFRPPSKNDDGSLAEHPQNYNVIKIMNLDERIRALLRKEDGGEGATGPENLPAEALSRVLSTWIDLQNAVNGYIDSSKDANARLGGGNLTPGIRQGLEKKEGLFRMHMMGKRVNFACRSVISPDPYIGTSEIGLPLRFAKVLTYSQPVTPFNAAQLREAVERGAEGHPGANYVEDARGRLIDLRRMDAGRRRALAARLLTPPGQRVWRHLQDGDMVLMNRQPTLHKPGIMAHRARVLRSPAQQTIRMHYANCNTYNADFDGDEMNCHFPQDELSRAEAETIACTDEQYLAPTNGKPLRGLIQDHVGSGVKLTGKDCFLSRADFQHILFCTLSGLPGVEVVPPYGHIYMPAPAIWKPQELWTGKQMISVLLQHLSEGLPPLNLDFKAKTPAVAFGVDQEEHEVVVRGGDLIRGVLDKAAFGASEGGLVHGVYEFYGPRFAGRLLTALGRLFTVYLQFAGHTCGVEDLVLSRAAEQRRRALITRAGRLGGLAMYCYTSGTAFEPPPLPPLPSASGQAEKDGASADGLSAADLARVQARTAELLEEDMRTGQVTQAAAIDNFMRTVLSPVSSDIIKACLPDGLTKPFPHNAFSLMVSTGAKGSTVNQSQISCGLGQQELEGRRVPLMPSGKSLPSFPPYDPSPRAGGFIVDRFLTGVRPQEYYFHCMAGREGLIDTAVKTSRSGYLQRCLVKGLEELRVHYDNTVRDADAGVVQFLYGEDGVDPLHGKYLDGQAPQMTALARNFAALLCQYKVDLKFLERTGMDLKTARAMHEEIKAARLQIKEQAQKREQKSLSATRPAQLKVGNMVLTKRLKRTRTEWITGAWLPGWEPAEVVKVHGAKGASRPATYDLRYISDGKVAKRVPRRIRHTVVEPSRPAASALDIPPPPPSSSASQVDLIRWPYLPDPVLGRAKTQLGLHLGAISERFQDAIEDYLGRDPEHLFQKSEMGGSKSKAGLELLLWLKYMRSLTSPGEAVGSIAGQSIGEPSTQMTLNTFHLAGHGGANVTLGIPRLREIIMTASRNPKTPSMTVPLCTSISRSEAQRLSARLRRLQLLEVVHHTQGGVLVKERLGRCASSGVTWQRYYTVSLRLHDEEVLQEAFGLSHEEMFEVIATRFVRQLLASVTAELRKVASRDVVRLLKERRGNAADAEARESGEASEDEADMTGLVGGRGPGMKAAARAGAKTSPKLAAMDVDGEEDEEREEEEDGDEAQGTLSFGRKEERGEYEPDEEEDPSEDVGDDASGIEEGVENSGEGQLSEVPAKQRRNGSRFDDVAAVAKIDHPFFENLRFERETGVAHITLKTRASHRRLLMVSIVEAAAERCTVRVSKGIAQAFVVEGKDGRCSIQTEGCNLSELWEVGDAALDLNNITSNDIWAMHQTYGVEAARATIVKEIKGVFGAYGIAVDPRHLGLVADFMTYQGGFRALNRIGMSEVSSPFLQMSFETTATFLTEAALNSEKDDLQTPSAKLVMGQPTGNGTGSFDIMIPVDMNRKASESYVEDPLKEEEGDRMEEA